MSKFKTSMFLFFLLFLQGCTKDLEITNDDDFEAQMAVNCLFQAGNNWYINLVSTKSPRDSINYLPIENPEINIVTENKIITDFNYLPSNNSFDLGIYTNKLNKDTVGNEGMIYNLKINKQGFEEISALDTIPPVPIFEYVKLNDVLINKLQSNLANDRYAIEGLLKIKIKPNHKIFNIKVKILNNYISNIFGTTIDSIYYSDALLNWQNNNFDLFFDSFSFDNLDTDNEELNINFSQIVHSNNTVPSELVLEVSSISNTYLKYLIDLKASIQASQNPFTTPRLPFTNIKNGYGIFAAQNTQALLIKL